MRIPWCHLPISFQASMCPTWVGQKPRNTITIKEMHKQSTPKAVVYEYLLHKSPVPSINIKQLDKELRTEFKYDNISAETSSFLVKGSIFTLNITNNALFSSPSSRQKPTHFANEKLWPFAQRQSEQSTPYGAYPLTQLNESSRTCIYIKTVKRLLEQSLTRTPKYYLSS